MTELPLTLRRWTRHEYERLVDLGLFQRDPVELIGGQPYRSVQILTPPAAIVPLAMPFTPIPVAKLLP
jgi:hypothetical protein